MFENACALGCEGIVSKLKGSRYTSGRTRDWIKVKNPNAPWANAFRMRIGISDALVAPGYGR